MNKAKGRTRKRGKKEKMEEGPMGGLNPDLSGSEAV